MSSSSGVVDGCGESGDRAGGGWRIGSANCDGRREKPAEKSQQGGEKAGEGRTEAAKQDAKRAKESRQGLQEEASFQLASAAQIFAHRFLRRRFDSLMLNTASIT